MFLLESRRKDMVIIMLGISSYSNPRLYISYRECKIDEGLDVHKRDEQKEKERRQKAIEENKVFWTKNWNSVNEFVGKKVFKEEDLDEIMSIYWKEHSRPWLDLTCFGTIPDKGFEDGEKIRGLKFDETLKKFALLPFEKGDYEEANKRKYTFLLALVFALKNAA